MAERLYECQIRLASYGPDINNRRQLKEEEILDISCESMDGLLDAIALAAITQDARNHTSDAKYWNETYKWEVGQIRVIDVIEELPSDAYTETKSWKDYQEKLVADAREKAEQKKREEIKGREAAERSERELFEQLKVKYG